MMYTNGGEKYMPRGDNLTREARAKGGRNSHSGGRKGGKSSSRGRGSNLTTEDRSQGGQN
jgi:hypothetical protein